MLSIAFTGHRPDKLGGYDWHTDKNQHIMQRLFTTINQLIQTNQNESFHFITGGALGTDQMAFFICNKLKQKYGHITTEIAVPFKQQYIKWSNTDIVRYKKQLLQTDKITYVDTLQQYKSFIVPIGTYNYSKMQQRNEYMVNHCDILIAVYNNTFGGTAQCVNYAKKLNKHIIIINPDLVR